MVVVDPHFEEVFKLSILSNVARREMVVIINYRLVVSVFVVKSATRFGSQQKVFVDKCHWSGSLESKSILGFLKKLSGATERFVWGIFEDDVFNVLAAVGWTGACAQKLNGLRSGG